jgi:chromosomal replication initiation ATPase DnaA
MDEKHSQLWQKLSAALKPQVRPDTFKRWFSAVKLVQATDETFTFRVPNNIYQFWIESNHMAALQAAIVSAFGSPRAVKFTTAADGAAKKDEEELPDISPKEFARDNTRDAKQSTSALGLNPRNNFESFVVGRR